MQVVTYAVALIVGGFVAYLAAGLMIALGVPAAFAILAGGVLLLVAVGSARQALERAELRRAALERERAIEATHARMNGRDHARSG